MESTSAKFGLILAMEALRIGSEATHLKSQTYVGSTNARPIVFPHLIRSLP